MNITMKCICATIIISMNSLYSMELFDETQPLPEYKRVRIEEWISKIPMPRSTIEAISPDQDIDFAAPKIFFRCVCQNCVLKYYAFVNLQQHCLDAHHIYLCECGKQYAHRYAFKWHINKCKQMNFHSL